MAAVVRMGFARSVSDFREVNKRIVRKPFPIPKITTVLQELEGFTYATALDLNMGYYTIRLDPDASRICTIIFPWGKYFYKRFTRHLPGEDVGTNGSSRFTRHLQGKDVGTNGCPRVCSHILR